MSRRIDCLGQTMFAAHRDDDEMSGRQNLLRTITELVGELAFDAEEQLHRLMRVPIRSRGRGRLQMTNPRKPAEREIPRRQVRGLLPVGIGRHFTSRYFSTIC